MTPQQVSRAATLFESLEGIEDMRKSLREGGEAEQFELSTVRDVCDAGSENCAGVYLNLETGRKLFDLALQAVTDELKSLGVELPPSKEAGT